MKILLFWLLFPLLIPQALYVRQTAPRFSPAKGKTQGSIGEGQPLRLLAIGDSIIAGVGATKLTQALVGQTAKSLAQAINACVEWSALGASGYDSQKILENILPKVSGQPFEYIIISVGVNDITGLTSLRNWRRNLTDILDGLHAHSPEAVIAVAGMPPMHGFPLLPQPLRAVFGMRANVFDRATIKLLEDHHAAIHVPLDFDPKPDKFSADGYHPSEESYAEFGRHMARVLIDNRSECGHISCRQS